MPHGEARHSIPVVLEDPVELMLGRQVACPLIPHLQHEAKRPLQVPLAHAPLHVDGHRLALAGRLPHPLLLLLLGLVQHGRRHRGRRDRLVEIFLHAPQGHRQRLVGLALRRPSIALQYPNPPSAAAAGFGIILIAIIDR